MGNQSSSNESQQEDTYLQAWYDQILASIRERATLVPDPPLPSQFDDEVNQMYQWADQFSSWCETASIPRFGQIHYREDDLLNALQLTIVEGDETVVVSLDRIDWERWLARPTNKLERLLSVKEIAVLAANISGGIMARYATLSYDSAHLLCGLPGDLFASTEYGNILFASLMPNDLLFHAVANRHPIPTKYTWQRSWVVAIIAIHTAGSDDARSSWWRKRITATENEESIIAERVERMLAQAAISESDDDSDDHSELTENQVRYIVGSDSDDDISHGELQLIIASIATRDNRPA